MTALSPIATDLFAWAAQNRRSVVAPPSHNPCTPPAEPPPEALAIRAALRGSLSTATALTAPRIAQIAGLWPDLRPADRGTRVRDIIATWYEVIQEPGRVLVSGGRGYWHTDDPEDVTANSRTNHSRIRQIALRDRRLRIQAKHVGMDYCGRGRFVRA